MASHSVWTGLPQGFPSYLSGLEAEHDHSSLSKEMEHAGEEIAELIAQACIEDEVRGNQLPATALTPAFPTLALGSSPPTHRNYLSSSSSIDSSSHLSCSTSPRSLSYASSSGSFVESPTSVLRRNGRDSWELLAAAAGRVQGFDCSSSLASSTPSTSASASPSVSPPRPSHEIRRNTSQDQIARQHFEPSHQQRRYVNEDRKLTRGRPQSQRQLKFEEGGALTGTGVFHPAVAQAQQLHPHQQKSTGAKAPTGNKQKQNNQPQNNQKKAPRPAPPVFIPERLVKALGLNVDSENNIVVNRPVSSGGNKSLAQAKAGAVAQVRAPPVMKLVRDGEIDMAMHKKHGGSKAVRPGTQGKRFPAANGLRNSSQLTQAASGVDELNLPNDWVY